MRIYWNVAEHTLSQCVCSSVWGLCCALLCVHPALWKHVLLCFLSSLRCWTKRTFFLLFLGFFCNKPSRNKVTNRIELKDVSYDSQAPFSNILLENKWARANVIELSEEIRSKMTERRRFKGGMKRQQVSQWEKDGCLLSLSFFLSSNGSNLYLICETLAEGIAESLNNETQLLFGATSVFISACSCCLNACVWVKEEFIWVFELNLSCCLGSSLRWDLPNSEYEDTGLAFHEALTKKKKAEHLDFSSRVAPGRSL